MLRMTQPIILAMTFVLSTACSGGDDGSGSDAAPSTGGADAAPSGTDSGAPSSMRDGPTTPTSRNMVDLTFEGALTATLRGMGGTCGGLSGGFSVQVRSADFGVTPPFELAMIILGESDWERPPTVLNVMGPSAKSFVWRRDTTGPVQAMRDRSLATFDVELRNVVGTDTVRVKGSVRCQM